MNKNRTGLLFGLSAFGLWGFVALYWSHLEEAGAYEIVANRSIWTLIFCLSILAFTKQLKPMFALIRTPRIAVGLFIASLCVTTNWIVFIWAVNHGHVVETSLGYYIIPVFMIATGTIFLKEKMRPLQWVATAIAAVGVLVLTVGYHHPPYVALALAVSWGAYTIIKRELKVPAVQSLAIEGLFLALPFLAFIAYLAHHGRNHFGHGLSTTLLLIGGGLVTGIPLLFFIGAANRLPLTTLGLMQYITPSLSFMIGVFVRHEEMSTYRWVGFIVVWIALFVLSTDLIRSSRAVSNSVTE